MMDSSVKRDLTKIPENETRHIERIARSAKVPQTYTSEEIEKRQNDAICIGAAGKAKFTENPNDIKDPLEYDINGTDPGLVVIFNQEQFENNEKRSGTHKDVEELIITLGRLKYNIESRFIFNDLTRGQITEEIKKICAMNLSNRNCLICIFLSHGSSDNMLETRDAPIPVEDIYKDFCQCPSLLNKPKLFLFQACKTTELKSKQMDEGDCESYGKTRKLVCSRTIKDDIPKDVLLLYSTIEGEVSFRHEIYGTWFIQELCRNLTAYGRRDDVFSIAMRTTKCVAYNYCFEETDGTKVKQLPIFISTLRHKFYLTRSKERLHLIEMNKMLKSLQHKVLDVKKMMEDEFST